MEPFCGGLAVATGLLPKRALLNDINPHVINLYRWLKRGLIVDLKMVNDATHYYECRNRFNELLRQNQHTSAEAAAIFYYLNRTGYNGLCRFNNKGEFNVPFGRYKTLNYRTDFSIYRRTFRRWTFTSLDFEEIEFLPEDLVYADPPYDVDFTHYSTGGFGWDDQERAARLLARHRGPVILSNQATPNIIELYESLGYQLHYYEAPRRISCTGDRTPAPEVIATRNT